MSRKTILGQEAICPDGLGRVVAFDSNWIQVDTYVNNRGCKWGAENVELIDPGKPNGEASGKENEGNQTSNEDRAFIARDVVQVYRSSFNGRAGAADRDDFIGLLADMYHLLGAETMGNYMDMAMKRYQTDLRLARQ